MCPICGSRLTNKYYDAIAWGTVESLDVCENCNLYSEQFAYGGYETIIGRTIIHSAHNDSPEEKDRTHKLIKAIVNVYKNTIKA